MIKTVGTDEPIHYPYPMARFGSNPFQKPMWRIVLTDSVKRFIGGRWPDGHEEYRLAKVYTGPGAKGKYVLESWISAKDHTGCTPEEYAIKFQARGCLTTIQNEPYPYEGTYVERHIFAGEPSGIEELIAKWHAERDIGWAERRRLRQEAMDYTAQKTRESELYRLRDAQPDPNGSMMIKQKRRQINPKAADKFKNLPGQGFRQLQGA